MAFLRPEAKDALTRWREVLVAASVALFGLWVASWGGWFFAGLGLLVVGLGVALAVIGLRRMRFRQEVVDPGIVEVVEGQLSYMGPFTGGFVGLRDLAELALVQQGAARFWRVVPLEGAPLMVPVAAAGSDALFDAFAGLPGLDSQSLLAALALKADGERLIWRRTGRAGPTLLPLRERP